MKFKHTSYQVDLRIVVLVLAVALLSSLVLWRPWSAKTASRTITMSGEASTKIEPDQFQFNPTYTEKGTDRSAMQTKLVARVNDVISKAKELGVKEEDITLSSYSYDAYYTVEGGEGISNTVTILVSDKELSQKLQDYLLTTTPDYQITPLPTLSTTKRKSAEDELRLKAIADAKTKAKATAKELGAKVGKTVSVTDSSSGVMPMMVGGGAITTDMKAEISQSLPVLPGRQEISYTVQVVFELQ